MLPSTAPPPADRAHAAHGYPGRRLRQIPVGYDPHRLPLGVTPAADEPAASWVRRVAARYHLRAGPLMASLGITAHPWTLTTVQSVLGPHHQRLRSAFGLAEGPLFQPGVTAHALTAALDAYLKDYHPRRARARPGTRFCPRCLQERRGGWRHEWQSPLMLVCGEHELQLLTRCPCCQGRPWSNSAWLNQDTPAWECARTLTEGARQPRTRIRRCGFDLRQARAVTADPHAVRVQKLLIRLAQIAAVDRSATGQFIGKTCTYYDACCAVMELLDAATPRSPVPACTGPDRSPSPPTPAWRWSRCAGPP